ncbi:MAG: hypothetical protein ACI4MC_05195 [Candidatus Coproplasma sp.]
MKKISGQKIKPYLFSAILIVLCVILSCGSVFAWFYYSRKINPYSVGGSDFGASLTLSVMRTDSSDAKIWQDVSSSFSSTNVQLDLGTMNNLNQLPENSTAYFKAEIELTTPAATALSLSVDDIAIEVWKAGASEAEESPYSATYEGVGDYYASYKYLSFSYLVADTELTCDEVVNQTFSDSTVISAKAQKIYNGSASTTKIVYFIIEPTELDGLQQLIKDIKVNLMPYYLNLVVTIKAEAVLGTPQTEVQV